MNKRNIQHHLCLRLHITTLLRLLEIILYIVIKNKHQYSRKHGDHERSVRRVLSGKPKSRFYMDRRRTQVPTQFNKLKEQQTKQKNAMKNWANTHKQQISEYRRKYYITKLKPNVCNNEPEIIENIRSAQREASRKYYYKVKARNATVIL